MDLDGGSYDWAGAMGSACPGGHLAAFASHDTLILLKALVKVRRNSEHAIPAKGQGPSCFQNVGTDARLALYQHNDSSFHFTDWKWAFPDRVEVAGTLDWGLGEPDDVDDFENDEENTGILDFMGSMDPYLADAPAAAAYPVLCMYGPGMPKSTFPVPCPDWGPDSRDGAFHNCGIACKALPSIAFQLP